MIKRLAPLVAGFALLVGCTAQPSTPPPAKAPTSSAPAPSSSAPATSAAPSPTRASTTAASSPASSGTAQVGDWIQLQTVKVKVYEISRGDVSKQNDVPDLAALVEACATSGGHAFDWTEWFLADTQNGQYQPTSFTNNDYPKPQFPFVARGETPEGSCVKGWIVFEVIDDVDLLAVAYASTSTPDGTAWQIS